MLLASCKQENVQSSTDRRGAAAQMGAYCAHVLLAQRPAVVHCNACSCGPKQPHCSHRQQRARLANSLHDVRFLHTRTCSCATDTPLLVQQQLAPAGTHLVSAWPAAPGQHLYAACLPLLTRPGLDKTRIHRFLLAAFALQAHARVHSKLAVGAVVLLLQAMTGHSRAQTFRTRTWSRFHSRYHGFTVSPNQ